MKRFVNPFVAEGSSASVIESGLIIVLIGLACMTAWMHVSASLKIPSASANTTASVETTGSVRSQELHRASRTRRLRRSEKRLYATGCPAQVRIGSIAPIEDRYALSRSCRFSFQAVAIASAGAMTLSADSMLGRVEDAITLVQKQS